MSRCSLLSPLVPTAVVTSLVLELLSLVPIWMRSLDLLLLGLLYSLLGLLPISEKSSSHAGNWSGSGLFSRFGSRWWMPSAVVSDSLGFAGALGFIDAVELALMSTPSLLSLVLQASPTLPSTPIPFITASTASSSIQKQFIHKSQLLSSCSLLTAAFILLG